MIQFVIVRCDCANSTKIQNSMTLHYTILSNPILSYPYTIAITQLLHSCYTSVTQLLHICYTSVTQLLHIYYTSVTQLLHSCYIAITIAVTTGITKLYYCIPYYTRVRYAILNYRQSHQFFILFISQPTPYYPTLYYPVTNIICAITINQMKMKKVMKIMLFSLLYKLNFHQSKKSTFSSVITSHTLSILILKIKTK